jgi:crossover junction endodeoxyribonuclease RuvC
MRILGIDPGIRNTGWGVVEMARGRLIHIANGVIKPDPNLPDADRLQVIAQGLAEVISKHKPTRSAIEEIFVARSAASALKLGMARGAAMMQCAIAGLQVEEIAARKVKKAIVGTGRATKSQVSAMITRLLGITAVNDDAADALAIAITAGHGDQMLGPAAGVGQAGLGQAGLGQAGLGLSAAIEAALARDAALQTNPNEIDDDIGRGSKRDRRRGQGR